MGEYALLGVAVLLSPILIYVAARIAAYGWLRGREDFRQHQQQEDDEGDNS